MLYAQKRMTMAEIRFENVGKSFGNVKVIDDLTLTIKDGEFFTFVGPSGCGKSTVLNMIAGLEDVSGGRVLFDREPVNDLSPKDRDVAMVFQSYALYPHMSVYENIAFPLRMKKEKNEVIDGEVRRVAALLGLEDLLSRKPKELSGGQRQRVALGRAVIRRPKVFLMDEPLSNLDARLRIETRAGLKRLHRELGVTTIYVTHDQAEALGLSDRIAVLHEGGVRQTGRPQEVYAKPANMLVAGFIGSPPMNFVTCPVLERLPLKINCAGIVLAPPVDRSPEGTVVTAGIRPEDVRVSRVPSVEGREVEVAGGEPAGPFDWVDFLADGALLKGTARTDAGLTPGSRAFMEFPAERVHIFDPGTGLRL